MKSNYENGRKGIDLDDKGVGYVYYPDGKIAIVSSPASDYQNRFFAFDRDRKSTVLLAVDEFAVGFSSFSKRKSALVEPSQCVLSKIGVLVSENGTITREWKWDGGVHGGNPPDSALSFNLNENLTFRILNKQEMSLSFQCENIRTQLDLSVKVRRDSSYLDNAKRELDGKIIPQIEYVSLKERQTKFNEEMKGRRNKLNPRSQNLTPMVSGIVKGLETNFDTIADKLACTTSAGTAWKSESLAMTVKELPKIPVAGTETGQYFGLGEQLYSEGPASSLAQTVVRDYPVVSSYLQTIPKIFVLLRLPRVS